MAAKLFQMSPDQKLDPSRDARRAVRQPHPGQMFLTAPKRTTGAHDAHASRSPVPRSPRSCWLPARSTPRWRRARRSASARRRARRRRRRRPASSAGSWSSRPSSTKASRARSAPPRPTARALWVLFGLSFAYGIFHAAGPGHGKAVISSYVVANRETWWRGVVLSFASAMVQAAVAVAVVGIAAVLLNATAATMKTTVYWIEIVSYSLIIAIGLRLVWVKGRAALATLARHSQAEDRRRRGDARASARSPRSRASSTHAPRSCARHAHHDHAHHDHAHHAHGHDHHARS